MLQVTNCAGALLPFSDRRWWQALGAGGLLALALGLWLATHPALPELALWLLVYPPLEEYVFRGLIQPWIGRHLAVQGYGVSAANGLTSVLFALTHLAGRGLHPLNALVFFPSLAFGYFRDRHKGIAGAIGLHMGWNLAFFLPGLVL